jgi:hypothetical protein
MKSIVPGLIGILFLASPAFSQQSVRDEVMRVDEAYRVAKLRQDTQALDRILADAFNETNQNGNSRNKAQTIELWKSFSIRSLTTDAAEVRVSGDTAMVIGRQTEDGNERMLFTRVYVRHPQGWQLLTSIQSLDPGGDSAPRPAAAKVPPGPAEQDVMRADEAYRAAKLRQDTQALDRILADVFNETNQNGNSRNKAETLELWKSFSIQSLNADSAEVRISGSTAVVLGKQTENTYERMLFTRVYVRTGNEWRLMSSMQFRDPHAGPTF